MSTHVVAAVVGLTIGVVGCGGDDDAADGAGGGAADAPDSEAGEADATDSDLDDEALEELFDDIDESDLLVPLDYLQGEWCDSDGLAWSIEDTTARFGESLDGPVGEVPVILVFHVGPEIDLVSQTDDQFVVDDGIGDPSTFTRGRC